MNTTELIQLLRENEFGGASGRPRKVSVTVNGRYIPEPEIFVDSTGDGIAGAEICLGIHRGAKQRESGEEMGIGQAVGMFFTIQSDTYSDEEKGEAIMRVCGMPSHNGIPKSAMLRVIWYLLNLCFDVPEDAKAPESWGRKE